MASSRDHGDAVDAAVRESTRRDRICTTQVKKAKKKEEIRIAREKAEKRIAAALEANNAKQRRKREVFDAKQVEVGTRRPVVPSLH